MGFLSWSILQTSHQIFSLNTQQRWKDTENWCLVIHSPMKWTFVLYIRFCQIRMGTEITIKKKRHIPKDHWKSLKDHWKSSDLVLKKITFFFLCIYKKTSGHVKCMCMCFRSAHFSHLLCVLVLVFSCC